MQVSTHLSRTIWTETEDDFLRIHYVQLSQRDIAMRLSRTKGEIQHRLEFLDLKLTQEQKLLKKQAAAYKLLQFNEDNRQDLYTKAEIEYLKQNYANSSNRELALKLGRSIEAILKKAIDLGLKKSAVQILKVNQVIVPAYYTREGREEKILFLKRLKLRKKEVRNGLNT
jgi:hypothetical protein